MNNEHLQTKSDLHILRKLWHVSGVLVLFISHSLLNHATYTLLFLLLALFSLAIDITRRIYPEVNDFVVKNMKLIMRKNEEHGWAGTTYLLSGVFIICFLFPPKITSLSLLFLAFADPIASFIGVKYGKDKLINGKSLQGSLAAFFTCFAISIVYFYYHNLFSERLIIVAIISGIIGALSELIPIGKLDDNFTLPLLSSIMLLGLFYIF